MKQEEREKIEFKRKMWHILLKDTVKFIKKNINDERFDEAKTLLDFLVDSSQILNN